MTRKIQAVSLALILATTLGLSACGQSGDAKKGEGAKKAGADAKGKDGGRMPQAVSVAPVEVKNFTGRLVVAGQVQAVQEARVFPTSSGARVIQIMADAGDRVVAGQALARLDGRQVNADSELLAAQVRRARTSLA
ncbi:MAG: lipoprotein, partial [Hyphomonadaceae bacterium]